MQKALAELVWTRAGAACEYCGMPQSLSAITFEIDHIIARKHNGPTEESNLCLSCFYCNSYKGSNIAGINAATGEVLRLFHPRRDAWSVHFRWNGTSLVELTDIGAVTITVLEINHPDTVIMRDVFAEEGAFPYSPHPTQ